MISGQPLEATAAVVAARQLQWRYQGRWSMDGLFNVPVPSRRTRACLDIDALETTRRALPNRERDGPDEEDVRRTNGNRHHNGREDAAQSKGWTSRRMRSIGRLLPLPEVRLMTPISALLRF